MEIQKLSEAEPEENEGGVQESTVLKKEGLVGEIGDQVVTVSEVTFRPGERTKMHKHTYGQVLYVVDGPGVVATAGNEREVDDGDLIFIPPGEEHWHGTGQDASSDFAHITYVLRDSVDEGTVAVE